MVAVGPPRSTPRLMPAHGWRIKELTCHRHLARSSRAGRVTLDEYAREWLSGRGDLRPTTRAKYDGLLNRHVLPTLGGTALSSLAPASVREWFLALASSHTATAHDSYRLLRTILNTAVADELIVRSPCQVKGAGSVRTRERPIATVEEVGRAADAVSAVDRLIVLLPAWCQLRRGEVLGLQRKDVDLLHGTLRIERAITVAARGRAVLGPPKTEAGSRTIAIPSNVIPCVESHLDRLSSSAPEAWLFAGSGPLSMSPRTVDRIWHKARNAIGRPDLTYHDLRHSGLTWAASTGATTANLMKRGGHSSPAAALRYQHATTVGDVAIASALAALQPLPMTRPDTAGGVA